MYLLLTVLAVQQPAPPLASPVSDTAHVVIVATTDVHGRVLGWDYVRDAAAPGGPLQRRADLDALAQEVTDAEAARGAAAAALERTVAELAAAEAAFAAASEA